ncbi:D-xylose transporter XylE [Thermoplasmatales archaeon]|nr:D-xylose transporter XylE [Thermoplasmatales archaeon]
MTDSVDRNGGRVGNIPARLERLPIGRYHWTLVILVAFIYMYESLDLGITGTVSTVLGQFPGHTALLIAFFGVAVTVGIVIGMAFSGRLADRYGKRRIVLYGLLVLLGMSGIIAIIPANFPLLIALRVIQGIGAGAVYAFPYSYLAEFIPKSRRGYFIGFIDLFFVFGYFLAPLISLYAIPFLPASLSWRVVFAIGFVPIVLYPLYYKYIPESPRWLERNGHYEKANRIVSGIEDKIRKQYGKDLPAPVITEDLVEVEGTKPGIRDLFQKKYLRYSIPLWIYTSAMLSGFYISTIYAPTIFEAFGFTAFYALLFTMIMNGLMLFPKMGVMFTADRVGRKKLGILLMSLAGVFAILLYAVHSSLLLVVILVFAVFWAVNANSPLWRMFASETYPTTARQTGVYFNEMVSRLWSGVIFTLIIGYDIVSTSLIGSAKIHAIYFSYLLIALISIVGAMSVYLLKETANKQLEKIEYEIEQGK